MKAEVKGSPKVGPGSSLLLWLQHHINALGCTLIPLEVEPLTGRVFTVGQQDQR